MNVLDAPNSGGWQELLLVDYGDSRPASKAAINLAIRLAFMANQKHLPDRNQAIETAVKGLFPRSTASDSGERIDHHFWGEKLVTLHEAYQKAKPTSLKQWWHDRRDSSQWTTFWLAVVAILLTLPFGLIQSISGIIQAVVTYHSQSCASS
jgi:hypothetical protein